MSLSTDIRDIITALKPEATFTVSSYFKANRQSFDLEEISSDAPFIILDNEQTEDAEIQQNANYLVTTQIKMYYLIKAGVYATDTEMEAHFDSIKPLVYQVANNIYQLPSMRLKGSELAKFKMIKRFKIFNSVLCGWEFTANWKFNEVANWCKAFHKTGEFISTDTPGIDTSDSFKPEGKETIKLS